MKVCKGHLRNIQELASKHVLIVDIVIMLKSKWVFSTLFECLIAFTILNFLL
jgi:hypothetical protein